MNNIIEVINNENGNINKNSIFYWFNYGIILIKLNLSNNIRNIVNIKTLFLLKFYDI